jgi:very-short-patch-repair endonuclease
MQLKGTDRSRLAARKLRRAMTLPEVLLWQELRKMPGGLRFRRQYPAGPYILDFFCAAARLAIEVDGEAHNRGASPAHDAMRDNWLRQEGVEVLRISARDILGNLEGAVAMVVSRAALRMPPPPPLAVPLPR